MPAIRQLLVLPDASVSVPRWHVSPAVDSLAYHWSWLVVLLPLTLVGSDPRADYFWIFLATVVVGFTHRHAMLPYVYLDRQVFWRHPVRFTLVPALMLVGFLLSPAATRWRLAALQIHGLELAALSSLAALGLQALWESRRATFGSREALLGALLPLGGAAAAHMLLPPSLRGGSWLLALAVASGALARDAVRAGAGRRAALFPLGMLLVASGLLVTLGPGPAWPSEPRRIRPILDGIVVFAATWNVWHVFMQKYGILRMYAAKSGVPPERRVPGWVDRLLVFGLLPLVVVGMGPTYRESFARAGRSVEPTLHALADVLAWTQPVSVPLAGALAVFSLGAFFHHEHRASGLRNPARLGMAAGTLALTLAFFTVDPVKVYVAYGFGHAVEYMVFVWAFQRRRYAAPLDPMPLWGRLLRWPWWSYGGFLLVVSLAYLWGAHGRDVFGVAPMKLGGHSLTRWVFYWTVWQSMLHFYFDGFLWKMRLPTVRAAL